MRLSVKIALKYLCKVNNAQSIKQYIAKNVLKKTKLQIAH